MKIDLPPVGVKKRIAQQTDVLNVRQKIEQRITWRRNQKLVAWVAKRPKHIGIRFTRAGRKEYIVDGNAFLVIPIVLRDRAAGGLQPPRVWVVRERRPVPPPIRDCATNGFKSAVR